MHFALTDGARMFVNKIILCSLVVLVCVYHSYGQQLRRGSGIIRPVRDHIGSTYGRRRPIRPPRPRSCTSSSQCGGRRSRWFRSPSCCRDQSGDFIDADRGSFGEVILDPTRSGTCSSRKGRPREVCNETCGCIPGYECYRPVTGACCPPKTCWTIEEAQRDRDRFNNCIPPNCFLPP